MDYHSNEVMDEIIAMLKHAYKESDYFRDNYSCDFKQDKIGEGGYGAIYSVRAKGERYQTYAKANYDVDQVRMDYEDEDEDEGYTEIWRHYPTDCNLVAKVICINSEHNSSYSTEITESTSSPTSERTSDGDTTTDRELATNLSHFVQCCQEAVLQSKILKHPNIVTVYDRWIQRDPNKAVPSGSALDIFIIVEYLEALKSRPTALNEEVRMALQNVRGLCVCCIMEQYDMDLKKWLETQTATQVQTNNDREIIITEFLRGLNFIHEKNYCHVDLKPGNVLIRKTKDTIESAITDFGLSRINQAEPMSTVGRPGTFPYNQAPDQSLTDKFDIWSFGLTVYEILCPGTTTVMEIVGLSNRAKEGNINDFIARLEANNTYTEIVQMSLRSDMSERADCLALYTKHSSELFNVSENANFESSINVSPLPSPRSDYAASEAEVNDRYSEVDMTTIPDLSQLLID